MLTRRVVCTYRTRLSRLIALLATFDPAGGLVHTAPCRRIPPPPTGLAFGTQPRPMVIPCQRIFRLPQYQFLTMPCSLTKQRAPTQTRGKWE
jgi:hypothetical protein